MITLYQESVPFSNKMFNGKISQDSKYTNPVIIPYAINSALSEDILETVIYVKNDDQSKYYKNVVVTLMTEDTTVTPVNASGVIDFITDASTLSLNATLNIPVDLAFTYPGGLPIEAATMVDVYKTSYRPIYNTDGVEVAFSYGYDELSNSKWESKASVLLIPMIGTVGLGDTSYLPIRMRIKNPFRVAMVTERKYFIDISFSEELTVGE